MIKENLKIKKLIGNRTLIHLTIYLIGDHTDELTFEGIINEDISDPGDYIVEETNISIKRIA